MKNIKIFILASAIVALTSSTSFARPNHSNVGHNVGPRGGHNIGRYVGPAIGLGLGLGILGIMTNRYYNSDVPPECWYDRNSIVGYDYRGLPVYEVVCH